LRLDRAADRPADEKMDEGPGVAVGSAADDGVGADWSPTRLGCCDATAAAADGLCRDAPPPPAVDGVCCGLGLGADPRFDEEEPPPPDPPKRASLFDAASLL